MVILTALSIPKLGIPDGIAEWLCWIIKMDGWANVSFYFFANLSPNRGQALGGSRVGPSNVFSALALVPAALFGFPVVAAFAVAGYYAVSNQLFPESQYGKAKTR
ncbi:Styrene-oxide isomerase [Talaromyces pinophilus]|nr:Styrene-oxide isomerase [Talaromyces pinophilus]